MKSVMGTLGLSLLAALVVFSSMASAEVKRITLDDAVQYAIGHNFGLQALKEEVNAREASIGVARARLFPKLGLVGGGEYQESNGVRESGALGYAFGQWNLFNGFADGIETQKANVLKEIAESEKRQSETEIRLEVESLFYRYLYKRKTLEFLDESLDLNDKHTQSVRKKMASGLTSVSDQMDFELRDSVLRSDSRLVQQDLVEIKLGLVRMMGPDLGMAFEPNGELAHFHIVGELDDYLAETKSTNEAVRQSVLNTENAILNLRQKRSAWLPSLDAELKFGVLPLDERVLDKTPGVSGLLVARWELFSGLGTKSEINEASATLRKKELEARQTLLTSMAGVENLVRKLKSIEERVDLEKKNEERAQRLYKSTLSEYSRGIKNSADLKSTEQYLLDAKIRNAGFKSEFLETKIDLERRFNIRVKVRELKDSHTLEDHANEKKSEKGKKTSNP